MQDLHRPVRVSRIAVALAFFTGVLAAAGTSYDSFAAPVAAPSATAPFDPSMLPAEFRSIRPAGIDGTAPPIPPSELWPAQ